mgnify:CR=1 FL=1
MRINLHCPYEEKDQAKALGARWDGQKKVWYVVDPDDLQPFVRWLGKNALDQREHLPNKKHGVKKNRRGHGWPFVTIGKHYKDVAHPAGLLPWDEEDPPELIRLVRDIGLSQSATR